MARVVIHLVPGEQRCGLWCPKCLLPSGIETPLYALRDDGIHQMATVRRCYDCDTPLPPDAAQ